MAEDALLRFAWVGKYGISRYTLLPGEVNSTLFAFLEIVRRFIWNFFRPENEHLNNCGEFRAVRDIYLAPLSDDLQVLEEMMDMEILSTDNINRKIKTD